MPSLRTGNRSTFYRLDGAEDRPVIVLSHSLGLDHRMWDPQAVDLLSHFRVLRYDVRGHGASSAPAGDYTIAELGADVLALADALNVREFAFCGLSLGGMIGQWLAANAPERVTRLVLANTSARLVHRPSMDDRRRTVLENGMAAVIDIVIPRFFSARMLASDSPSVEWARQTVLSTDPIGYAGCCAAIRDMDQTATLAAIRAPTLLIVGDCDVPMPWAEHGDVLAKAIVNARVVRLPAGHISNLECPEAFTSALREFVLS